VNNYTDQNSQMRYVIARLLLRRVLSSYLECSPSCIELKYGIKGKPYLSVITPRQLEFNLSHCRDSAVLGVCWDFEIGVDIENGNRKIRSLDQFMRRFFTDFERNQIVEFGKRFRDGNEREVALKNAVLFGWTLKEAFVKATGEGIVRSLTSFDIDFALNMNSIDAWKCSKPSIHSIDGFKHSQTQWNLQSIDIGSNMIGSFALNSPNHADCCLFETNYDELLDP